MTGIDGIGEDGKSGEWSGLDIVLRRGPEENGWELSGLEWTGNETSGTERTGLD